MNASLEAEAKGKAEALKIRKKLEQDINELEVALDAANRAKAEMEKNIKRYQQQITVSIWFPSIIRQRLPLTGNCPNKLAIRNHF